MRKTKKSILILAVAIALWAVTLLPKLIVQNEILEACKTEAGYNEDCIDRKVTKEKKLKELCRANPEVECQKLRDYCDEALETGNECYLFGFPIY